MDQASNAFSVVGAADVVIRSSTNLYSLLKRLADAPENYSQLTSTLKSLTSLTTAVREYADEYNESTFVRKDGLNPLEELNMILSDCQFHIKRVTDFVNSCPMNVTDKIFWNWVLRSKYVLQETEIAKTCQKLQEHMRSIMFILSVNSA